MSKRKRYWLPSVALSVLVSLVISSANAATPPLTTTQGNLPAMVAVTPSTHTPQVHFSGDAMGTNKIDGMSIVTPPGAKSTMITGGLLSRAKDPTTGLLVARNNAFGFDPNTGAVSSFNPDLNGEVRGVLPSATQSEVYLFGDFTTAQGVPRRGIAKFVMSTGKLDPNFNANLDGSVSDAVFVANRLIIMGSFEYSGSTSRPAIAYIHQLDGTTDTGTGYFGSTVFAGTSGGSTTRIYRGAPNPQGTALVVIGNFSSVGGFAHQQAVMLMMGSSSATVAAWNNAWFSKACSSDYAYFRAVAWAPTGSTFYLASTGGPHYHTFCDTVSSFPYKPTDSTGRINWMMFTDGDTNHSLIVTNVAIYVGGHFRYFDVTGPEPGKIIPYGTACDPHDAYEGVSTKAKPRTYGYDCPTATSIYRPGSAALNPTTGAILSWDPQRTRAEGAKSEYITTGASGTPTGLWVGSDGIDAGCNNPTGTNHDDCEGQPLDVVGGIAFFPLTTTAKITQTNLALAR